MSVVGLEALPDEARVWVFGAAERPSADAAQTVAAMLSGFFEEWTAHRAALRAGFGWLEDRFLVVAVDESATGASGCSIDALTGRVRELEAALGVSLLDGSPVWLRDPSGAVASVSRAEFREMARRGEVDAGTRVFDLTVESLGAVRTGDWEGEAGRSWHAALL